MNNKNILVPNLPESISDAIVAVWHKKIGEPVKQGELLVELETDKIMLEVPAEVSGILKIIFKNVGTVVTGGQVLGTLSLCTTSYDKNIMIQPKKNKDTMKSQNFNNFLKENNNLIKKFSPSVRQLIKEYDLKPELILKNDLFKQITRDNIKKYLLFNSQENEEKILPSSKFLEKKHDARNETRIPMTRLRKRIAERLLNAKNNTAMLTTFNEVNMQPIINLRKKYGQDFEKRYGVRLGFMSFYVKGVLEALKIFPKINASIDGDEIVYHNYFDISIAVSTERGLVTPVLRNVNLLNINEIETQIKFMAEKSRDGKLKVEDLSGGNFTITNGGIFGSLISTPIINPPQSAILGMHAITDRPMAVNGKVIILPMMYLALSYDHRLIDGKESVSFLTTIKNILENPMRFLLNI